MSGLTRSTATVGLVAILLIAGVAMAGPASADDPCPLLEPSCVVDTLEDVVDDTTDAVDDTVDEVTGTAEQIVDDTTNAVGDVVDDTVGGGDPGPGGGGGGNGGGDGDGNGGGDPDDRNGGDASGDARRRRVRPGVVAVPSDLGTSSLIVPSTGRVVNDDAGTPERRVLGLTLVPLATSMALMFIFLALAVGFVSFQHALDRRDPKLAPDTLGSDRVPFA